MEKKNFLERRDQRVRVVLRNQCQEQGSQDISPLSQFLQGISLLGQGALVIGKGLELIDQSLTKSALSSN